VGLRAFSGEVCSGSPQKMRPKDPGDALVQRSKFLIASRKIFDRKNFYRKKRRSRTLAGPAQYVGAGMADNHLPEGNRLLIQSWLNLGGCDNPVINSTTT
jgi:hypothetical protein